MIVPYSNNEFLTMDQRQMSLTRALHSQNFFNLLQFGLNTAGDDTPQYTAKAQVDKDYWLTEIKGNFGNVWRDTGTYYLLNTYIANKGYSLIRYIRGEMLPTEFQCTDAKTVSALSTPIQDRQREYMPTLVPRNDNIIARVQNIDAKSDIADIQIVTSGYYTTNRERIAGQTKDGVKESLAKDIEYDEWQFTVNEIPLNGGGATNPRETHIFNNDRFARMVLGFGVRCRHTSPATAKVIITDVYRNIKLNNDPIEVGFFAPKQGAQVSMVKDVQFYYLPIEHFWQPFAPLKFEFSDCNLQGQGSPFGWEFVMLTRTV